MPRKNRRKANFKTKIGKPPGTLIYTGSRTEAPLDIRLISYSPTQVDDHKSQDFDELMTHFSAERNNWIDVHGLHNVPLLEKIGAHFGIHSLVLEDILSIDSLPKFEDFGDHIFFNLKMLTPNVESRSVDAEHVSFVLGKDYLISFQEKEGDVFDSLRERILAVTGKAVAKQPDYLLYRLIDIVVDHYYIILEGIGDDLDALEDKLLNDSDKDDAQEINRYKRELQFLKRNIYPLRDAIRGITGREAELINEDTIKYFNDVRDHLAHIIEYLEGHRDTVNSLMDLHLTAISNRMNDVMKTLTIVGTIFIPLTFIAGIYGMNFQYMPELSWEYSYPVLILIMIVTGGGMFLYMKRKRWF